MTAKWQDWASFALGLWLALSPWIAGYAEHAGATAKRGDGGARSRASLRMRRVRRDLPVEWLNLGAGIWLVCAPWMLDFASSVAAANSVAVGVFIFALAASALSLDKRIGALWHRSQ